MPHREQPTAPAGAIPDSFEAFRVEQGEQGVQRGVRRVGPEVLPAGAVTVAVTYSSLNYKDALSASGNRGVSRNYPHTPGIDAAGRVVASSDERFAVGDEVICTGFDLGMNTPGGWGQYVVVPAEWLVKLPAGLAQRAAMALGTAGVTAALAVDRLQGVGVEPASGPVVVTGASGGVGSLSVALLAARGYEVIAASGKPQAAALLERLGAGRVVGREEFAGGSDRPLLKGEFAAAIDGVGGATLATLLKRTKPGGAVAAYGLVGGAELALTVYPFILRGVALLGVDSAELASEQRPRLWQELARTWREAELESVPGLVREVGLAGLEAEIVAILRGEVSGRVVVRVAA